MIKEVNIQQNNQRGFPLNIPSIQSIDSMVFKTPITILVGDNGSGKSTFLLSLAKKHDAINTSMYPLNHPYYDRYQPLVDKMTLTYDIKHKKGFMFSGEAFITYIHHLQDQKKDLEAYVQEVEKAYQDKSDFARNQALAPAKKELYAIKNNYDGDLQEKSHGEGFLSFFKARMHQQGIYFLDEPETPLSSMHQYQLFVLLNDLAASGSQIIIATHSPILMALNHATIYEFTDTIQKVNYEDVESVRFMKYFLNHTKLFKEKVNSGT